MLFNPCRAARLRLLVNDPVFRTKAMKPRFARIAPVLLLSACGAQVSSIDNSTSRLAGTSEKMAADLSTMTQELKQDRELIQSITQSLTSMSRSMEELSSMVGILKAFIADQNKTSVPAAATPDIDEVLK